MQAPDSSDSGRSYRHSGAAAFSTLNHQHNTEIAFKFFSHLLKRYSLYFMGTARAMRTFTPPKTLFILPHGQQRVR